MADKVDNLGRKVWDKEFYSMSKEERDRIRGLNLDDDKNKSLNYTKDEIKKKRETYLDLSRGIGIKKITKDSSAINSNGVKNAGNINSVEEKETSGYWCELCKLLFNDSHSWVNHINSLKHNQKVGTSLFIEKRSLDEVKQHLDELIEKYDSDGKLIEKKNGDDGDENNFHITETENAELLKYDFPTNFV
ncbi:U1 like C2H2 zinc finger [Cryptosporidium xiaoi]|uniref:U1 like C2H2 zinc finger n=1 Tax=Cryptosporidium xiaoi TaxID=659607 RepID=A0AAV9XZ43_9CRYT